MPTLRRFPIILPLLALAAMQGSAQLVEHETPVRFQTGLNRWDTTERSRLIVPTTISCHNGGEPYEEYLEIVPGIAGDTLSLRIMKPEWITIESVSSTSARISTPALPAVNSRPTIMIETVDENGYRDTVSYAILVSDPVLFSMPVIVRNTSMRTGVSSYRKLIFGTAPGAVTGQGPPGKVGDFDERYCEFELPPRLPRSFDARWVIWGNLESMRNFYPAEMRDEGLFPPWSARYFPGDEASDGDSGYPLHLVWSKKDARKAPWPLYLSDPFGGVFRVNMQTGEHWTGISPITVTEREDSIDVSISIATIDGFKIEANPAAADLPGEMLHHLLRIASTPNPSTGPVTVDYHLPSRAAATIEIFNQNGEWIRTLADGIMEPGTHRAVWDGRMAEGIVCAAGIYLCRLISEGRTISHTLIMMR